jgi:hypothetical protein
MDPLSNPRTLGDTQRRFLATLRDVGHPMSIPEVGATLGMSEWRREYLYRPMEALHRRGMVHALPDPRRDDWTLWTISRAGCQALESLGL